MGGRKSYKKNEIAGRVPGPIEGNGTSTAERANTRLMHDSGCRG